MTALAGNNIVVVPIRAGVGLRKELKTNVAKPDRWDHPVLPGPRAKQPRALPARRVISGLPILQDLPGRPVRWDRLDPKARQGFRVRQARRVLKAKLGKQDREAPRAWWARRVKQERLALPVLGVHRVLQVQPSSLRRKRGLISPASPTRLSFRLSVKRGEILSCRVAACVAPRHPGWSYCACTNRLRDCPDACRNY